MEQWVYKIGLVLLMISLEIASLEISFVVAVLLTTFFFVRKISNQVALIALMLLILVFIGLFKVFDPEMGYYHFLKDFIYYVRPILILLCSYFLVRKLKNRTDFFNILVWLGGAYAFVHLGEMVINATKLPSSISYFRYVFGRYNHIETIALCLLICIKDLPIKKRKNTLFYYLFLSLLSLSFLLYFSRTMILVAFLIVISYFGYLKLSKKGALGVAIVGALAISFLGFLTVYNPSEEGGMLDTFLLKVKNSYSESFNFKEVNVRDRDRRELWSHWRGYEASVVMEENHKDRAWFFGQGFGSTIDIGFEAKLNGELTQFLSLTHNGFAYVYLKTGLFGLVVYLLLILYFYSFYYAKPRSALQKSYNYLLVGCGFYIIVTSFTVTGIFKPYDITMVLAGGIFALKQLEHIENRDTRNTGNT